MNNIHLETDCAYYACYCLSNNALHRLDGPAGIFVMVQLNMLFGMKILKIIRFI